MPFDPFAHVCLKLQKDADQRRVRQAARAKTSLNGELHAPDAMPCYVADLSATGARIAVDYPLALQRGSSARLALSIPMLATKRDLSLEATIVNALGVSDPRFPEVSFYGIQFKAPTELDSPRASCLCERRTRGRSEQSLADAVCRDLCQHRQLTISSAFSARQAESGGRKALFDSIPARRALFADDSPRPESSTSTVADRRAGGDWIARRRDFRGGGMACAISAGSRRETYGSPD